MWYAKDPMKAVIAISGSPGSGNKYVNATYKTFALKVLDTLEANVNKDAMVHYLGKLIQRQWPGEERRTIDLFKKYGLRANIEVDEELDKALKDIPEETLAALIEAIKDNKMTIPTLKLAFPEIVFNSDLLNKLRNRESEGV